MLLLKPVEAFKEISLSITKREFIGALACAAAAEAFFLGHFLQRQKGRLGKRREREAAGQLHSFF